MKLDELRTVQSKERRKDSLQQLRDSFYEDVAAYIQDLKASRDRRAKQVDDPFSDDEVRRLSDELETAEEVAEAVYERRVGKVVKLASFAAADMPVDDEGMTSEERELFEDLVDRISQNKQTVLDVLSGSKSTTAAVAASESTDSQSTPSAGPAGGTTEPKSEPAAEPESAPEPPAAGTPADSEPSDNMLADAMAPDDQPALTAESDSVNNAKAEAVAGSTAPSDTDPQLAAGESTRETPPPQPEATPDADAVVETTTDGGTAAANGPSSADSSHSAMAEAETRTPETTETATDDEDRTTLRITKNVGEIFGVDGREYTLRSEDVVTLPTTNAEPLVERDAARRLE